MADAILIATARIFVGNECQICWSITLIKLPSKLFLNYKYLLGFFITIPKKAKSIYIAIC